MTLFALEGVDVFYGKAQALHAVDLRVARGEIVSLVGRNGAGKTTILRAAMGLLPCARGRRVLEGADITGLPPHGASRCGVALVPADRQVFPTLDVLKPHMTYVGGVSWTDDAGFHSKHISPFPGAALMNGDPAVLAGIGALQASVLLPALADILNVYAPPLVIARLLGRYANHDVLTLRDLAPYIAAFAGLWLTGQACWRLTTILLTLVPPLWQRLMTPLLLAWDRDQASDGERRLAAAASRRSGAPAPALTP